jgi:hypothetical protein
MLIEVIKLDETELILKLGNTEEECCESIPLFIESFGIRDLYTLLIDNRSLIENHLKRQTKRLLIPYKFPDGIIPLTRL